MFSGGEVLPAGSGAKNPVVSSPSGPGATPAHNLETVVIELGDADLMPFEVDPKPPVCEMDSVWKPSVLFNDAAPLTFGVPENIHLYPVVEQARQFLERYPQFNNLGETSNFKEPSVRAEFLFSLADEYSKMNKTMLDDGKGHWVNPNWEGNFERALDKVQAEYGVDVRDGASIPVMDANIISSWEISKGTIELEVTSDFLKEKTNGWEPTLKAEFAELYKGSLCSLDGLEERGRLEADFRTTVKTWLTDRRGMPTDVVERIMNLGIPVEEVPRYVDIAIKTHSIPPPHMPKFLADFALGGVTEVYDPVVNGWDLALDSEVYFKERYEKLKMHVSELQAKNVIEHLGDVLMEDPMKPLEDGSVFESELNSKFEKAVKSWLRHRLSLLSVHTPSMLGGKTADAMAAELMKTVRRTGVEMEMAVGFLSMAASPDSYGNDPGFLTFQRNLENVARYKATAAESATKGAEVLASIKSRAVELPANAIVGMEAGKWKYLDPVEAKAKPKVAKARAMFVEIFAKAKEKVRWKR